MECKIFVCDVCGREAKSEIDLRYGNWITLDGGSCKGLSVWLDKPRKKIKNTTCSLSITVGYHDRRYHFCSIACIERALKGNESI